MPKYLFTVATATAPEPIDVVHDLADFAAAKRQAVLVAADLIRDDVDLFWQREEWRMTVADEAGLILFSLIFYGMMAAGRAPAAGPRDG